MEPIINVEAIAVEEASKALTFIEQLESVRRHLQTLKKAIPNEFNMEMDAIIGKLACLIEVIENDPKGVVNLMESDHSLAKMNRVTRLNLAPEIIRLRSKGNSYAVIAKQLGISDREVSTVIKAYDAAKPLEKAQYRRRSIYDTTQQWEDIGAMIYRLIARLEHERDAENHVRAIAEYRQIIAAAQKWMEYVNQGQQLEQLKNLVVDILSDELPERRVQIMKRFQQAYTSVFLNRPEGD